MSQLYPIQRKKRWIQETSIPPRYQLGNGIYHFHCSLAGFAGIHSWVLKKRELVQGNKKQSLQKYHNPKICIPAHLPSCVQLFAAPWTVAHQAPLPMEFSRQEYWNGVAFPPPMDLPNSGIKPMSLASPTLAGGFFTTSASWEISYTYMQTQKCIYSSSIWVPHSFLQIELTLEFIPFKKKFIYLGFPWWLSGKESACQGRRHGFDPWSRKMPHAKEQLDLCTYNDRACVLEPRSHSYWSLLALEPVPHHKRSPNNEKPVHQTRD